MKHKKSLSCLLSLLFLMSSILPLSAASFADINQVPWAGAETYINKVADAGLMVGDTNASGTRVFRPKDTVTYCETAQLVYTLLSSYYGATVTADVQSKYASTLQAFSIPAWAQPAISFCLDKGALTASDLAIFMQNSQQGASANATRENVALYFGRGLSAISAANNSAALTFNDAASISAASVPYIDILVRAQVITGDNLGNFNPKNTINRSEMAVIVSKTNDYLTSAKTSGNGAASATTGVITGTIQAVSNTGAQKQLTIRTTDNKDMKLSGTDATPCLKNGSSVSFSTLKAGDRVTVSYKGEEISSVILLAANTNTGTGTTTNTDVKGTTVSGTYVGMNNSVINIDVNGRAFAYNLANEVIYVLGGYNVNLNNMISSAEYGDKITLTLNDNNEIIKASVTMRSTKPDVTGYYKDIGSSYITLKKSKGSSSTTKYYFASNDYSNVDFFVDDSSTSYSKFKDKVSSNDEISLFYDDKEKVIEVWLDTDEEDYDEEGYFSKMTDEYISISSSKNGSATKYYFADEDADNVDFYVNKTSKSFSKFDNTVESKDKIGLVLNKDDEVIEVYLIDDDDDDDDDDYDKKGYFSKLSDEYISISKSKSGSATKYYFEDNDSDNAKFYIDGSSKSYTKFDSTVESGDEIGLVLNSDDEVTKVYLLDDDDDDDDYDKEGYFADIGNKYISIKKTKSGTGTKYYFDDEDSANVKFYVDGSSKTFSKFKSTVEDDDSIGLVLNKDDEVTKVYLLESKDDDDEELDGYFSSLASDDKSLYYKSTKSASPVRYYFKSEDSSKVTFYIDKESVSYSKFKYTAQENDELVLELNSKDQITKAYLTMTDDDDYDKEGYFYSLSTTSIRIRSTKTGSATKYDFVDEDYENVKFYVDDSPKTYSKFKSTVEVGDKIGITLNDKDEITRVYLID